MPHAQSPSGILMAVLATLGASACATESIAVEPDEPPPFSTVRNDRLLARVRVGKDPVEGAVLTIRRLEQHGGGVLALGRSDSLGFVDTPLSLLADEEEVEIVVQKRGLRARHGDAERQAQLGLFAPSLIRKVPASSLRALDIALEEGESQ